MLSEEKKMLPGEVSAKVLSLISGCQIRTSSSECWCMQSKDSCTLQNYATCCEGPLPELTSSYW